ncbi:MULTISPECIES: iron-containing alcohol dehydrogenase [Marichromatium]|uniref:NADP-dependent alcohol dehydrogenase n=1 Tax=Marichromatium gracile TaxID=1048 RepID=A0A4R4AGL6_MARGR|nr:MULTISPECIES: iron-containing alcohol dehydrogenase [Marichromatium]MBK1707892.1 NADH-dependent alcohol dehydrogenase [Marichromatium gracile]RNE88834.1 iron-containing alcohol dehydrogenase [Marichromatium sp. AB31]TCW38408.1 NADP-dependent alcohol dehydrogenase [Marichromatium gracile]
MDNFVYENPTRIHFGSGQIAALAEAIPTGARVLMLYGGGSIKSNGVYDQVAAALAGFDWEAFGGIEPNPRYDTLMRAVERVRAGGFDYLLAVGGGSVIDGTKFVAAAACHPGDDPWAILAEQAPVREALPLGCVLTLPATGSETNINAVVTRAERKLAFYSPLVRPRFAILDPATTLSLAPRQIANGVVDAFVHVIEQYLTYPADARVQDRFAEGLLLTLIETGPKALDDPNDLALRADIMWAASLALNGLIGCGVPQDWATHRIGHELTAHFGIDHGRSLTIVLPALMQARRTAKRDKLLQYAERVFGIDQGEPEARIDQAIAQTRAFFQRMGVETSLADAGLDATAIDTLVAGLEDNHLLPLGERGDIGSAEVRAILEGALR